MKILLLILVILSLAFPAFAHSALDITLPPLAPEESIAVNNFKLWVDEEDWELGIMTQFPGFSYEIRQCTDSDPSYYGVMYDLDLKIDAGWIPAGNYDFVLDISLSNSNWSLIYQSENEQMFYPGSPGFLLEAGDESIELTPNKWYLLGNNFFVYWNENLVISSNIKVIEEQNYVSTKNSETNNSKLEWLNGFFNAEVGESLEVVLNFERISVDDSLVIELSSGFLNLGSWFLDGEPISPLEEGNFLIFNIPQSEPLKSKLEGKILATLAFDRGELYLKAVWLEDSALLIGRVEGGWFDKQGVVVVETTEHGVPSPSRRFLLSNNKIGYTDREGRLELHLPEGLHRLVCLDSQIDVIWVNVSSSPVTVIPIELGPVIKKENFFVSDLFIQNGVVSWRYHGSTDLQINEIKMDEESFKLKGDYQGAFWTIEGDKAVEWRLGYHYPFSESVTLGNWNWVNASGTWHGRFQGEGLGVNTTIKKGQQPRFGILYENSGWRLRTDFRSFTVTYKARDLIYGVGLSNTRKITGWIQADKPVKAKLALSENLIFSIKWSERATSELSVKDLDNWKVTGEFLGVRSGLQFEIRNEENNFRPSLRGFYVLTGDRVALTSALALKVTHGVTIWEGSNHFRLPVNSSLSLNVGMITQFNGRNLDYDLEMGIDIKPFSWAISSLTWRKSTGFKWGIGLSFVQF